ncbi:MAG TPA: thiamine pyrophosphate-binding protein [Candidatus Binataceae bacterium]|nr:thiamine pyrophosphate-binding protein [Candidatus Binataceae bacterium]
MATRRMMVGSEAFCEGAIAAGVRFFAGYPITPATEIFEIMSRRLPETGGMCIQMEDELGAISACMGAALTGLKVITSTSGPGFTLMQSGISDAAATEIPLTVINIQRSGPGAGDATSSAQMEFMQARWGGNGDQARIVLSPSSVEEAYLLTIKAVNFAERFRVPVIVQSEQFIAHMREVVNLPDPDELEIIDRPLPVGPPEDYYSYRANTVEDVPPLAPLGSDYRANYYYSYGAITESGPPEHLRKLQGSSPTGHIDFFVRRLVQKVESKRKEIIITEATQTDDAEYLVVAYGAMARSAKAAALKARERGVRAGALKLTTLWPFPYEEIAAAARNARAVIVPEMAQGQLQGEVIKALRGSDIPIIPVQRVDTVFISDEQIETAMRSAAR